MHMARPESVRWFGRFCRAGLAVGLVSLAPVMPGLARAQVIACRTPADIERPRPDLPDARQPRRLVPVARYTLALSWTPQICRDRGETFQCSGGNRFGFVLHGLWPDGAGRTWPQYCRAVPLLSEATLRANLCTTPSVQLLQHEWAKHGSCMSGSADAYFARARALYAGLAFPDMAALSRTANLTQGRLAAAFARANPGMSPQMLRIVATRDGWLEEVWLCHDRAFRRARCPNTAGDSRGSATVRIWRGD